MDKSSRMYKSLWFQKHETPLTRDKKGLHKIRDERVVKLTKLTYMMNREH